MLDLLNITSALWLESIDIPLLAARVSIMHIHHLR